jgi:tripeptide aminopeptidase
VDEAVIEENKRWDVNTLAVTNKLIGDRPGGRTAADSVIVEAAVRANSAFGPHCRRHRQNSAMTGYL